MRRICLFCIFLISINNFYSNNNKIPADFFGLHMHKVIKGDKPWPTIPFKTWRLWDTGICWPTIQPKADKWNFSLLDKAVRLAEEYNVDIVLDIGLSPKWAAKRPKDKSGYGPDYSASEPKDIEIWKNYIKTLAERYKGKIKYWEIWNEPDMRLFYTGSSKEMVNLVKEAYIILKEVDPENMIISPPVTGYLIMISWLDNFLKDGGKDFIDIIGTHYYVWFKTDKPENIINTINKIKLYAEKNGIKDKPIWNTECGFRQKNVINKDLGSGYIARLAILQWYFGIERFMPYSWDNNYIIRMVDSGYKNVNHIGIAYKETQKWLIDSRVKSLEKIKNNIWFAKLKKDNNGKAVMIWHANDSCPDKKIEYMIPEEWGVTKIYNLKGESSDIKENKIYIGVAPILLANDKYTLNMELIK